MTDSLYEMRSCALCGKVTEMHFNAVYCSETCKQRAYKMRKRRRTGGRAEERRSMWTEMLGSAQLGSARHIYPSRSPQSYEAHSANERPVPTSAAEAAEWWEEGKRFDDPPWLRMIDDGDKQQFYDIRNAEEKAKWHVEFSLRVEQSKEIEREAEEHLPKETESEAIPLVWPALDAPQFSESLEREQMLSELYKALSLVRHKEQLTDEFVAAVEVQRRKLFKQHKLSYELADIVLGLDAERWERVSSRLDKAEGLR